MNSDCHQQPLLSIINRVLETYASSNSTYESLSKLLEFTIQYTESEFGFIGEVLSDSDGQRYLKSHALTNIAWNKETLELYTKSVSTGLEFRNNNTLFGVTIKSGKPYISNNPLADSNSGGTPKGHPPLKTYIGIPIYNKYAFIGMLGLANRKNGYTYEIVNDLKPLFPTVTTILQSFKLNKQAEENKKKLRENEHNLVSIITSIEDEVIEINKDYEIINYWTSAKTKINMHFIKQVFELFPSFISLDVQLCIDAVFRDGEKRVFEYKNQDKWIALSFTGNLSDSSSSVTILVQDITKRKNAELKLLEKVEIEKIVIKNRSHFLSVASHELKSPLASLTTAIDLIRLKTEKDEHIAVAQLEKYFNMIKSEANRANTIVKDLLVLGKLDANSIEINKELVYLPAIITDLTESYKNLYPQSVVNLSLMGQVKQILTDVTLVNIIFNNAISNAFKYSKPADICVNISINQLTDGIEVVITDKGIGMAEADLDQLFSKPFFRAADKHAEGTGLGLLILKQGLSKLNGKFEITSELNVGTTIKISLPEK